MLSDKSEIFKMKIWLMFDLILIFSYIFPLEYGHEPGIALQQLEFGRIPTTEDILEQYAPVLHRARCSHCGVDYESGRLIFRKSVI